MLPTNWGFNPKMVRWFNPNPPVNWSDWDAVQNWVKEVKRVFEPIEHASRLFMAKIYDGRAWLTYEIYYKDGEHYVKEVREGFVPIAELPDRLQAKFDSEAEVDITDEIKPELNLTL